MSEELDLIRKFYEHYDKCLKVIEDLFAGKSFKPIHDAMELHVERFNKRILDIESEDYSAQLEGLEEKVCDELEIIKDFNTETQKGFNRLSERIEMSEKTISELVDKIAEIGNHYYREKQTPHKCPVCEGSGGIAHPLVGSLALVVCKSCKGEGIIWG